MSGSRLAGHHVGGTRITNFDDGGIKGACNASPIILRLEVINNFQNALQLLAAFDGDERHVSESYVEVVLDHSLSKESGRRGGKHSGETMVKHAELDLQQPSLVQGMPSGRDFLIRCVADLKPHGMVYSDWVRGSTLPLKETLDEDAIDLHGDRRGECECCSCAGYVFDRRDVKLTVAPTACYCCGCLFSRHKMKQPESKSPSLVRARILDDIPAVHYQGIVQCPEGSSKWSKFDRDLYQRSGGRFNPRDLATLRNQDLAPLNSPLELLTCRCSVVCPTTEDRQQFHEQLWKVFQAQHWSDKELVVVETYTNRPSPFFVEKSKHDDRILYVSFRVDPDNDWTVGLKRNMCTYLASGLFLASFDDDDLYAPNYLSTMLHSLCEQRGDAITLSGYCLFDVRSGKFGWVDSRGGRADQVFGYGFSYVFFRDVAIQHPYPDINLGEDFVVMQQIRQRQCTTRLGGQQHVVLLFDEYGICCHTMHPKNTAGVFAQRQLPDEGVGDLDIVDLGLLDEYTSRFPRTADNTKYIGRLTKRSRTLFVFASSGKFTVPCSPGATAAEVKDLLWRQMGCCGSPSDLQLHRTCPPPKEEVGGWVPAGPVMSDTERIGLRCTELWATAPVDRGASPDVEVELTDVRGGVPSLTVRVHRISRLEAVRQALVEHHGGSSDEQVEVAANKLRFDAVGKAGLSEWLGTRRSFSVHGLAELLDTLQIWTSQGVVKMRFSPATTAAEVKALFLQRVGSGGSPAMIQLYRDGLDPKASLESWMEWTPAGMAMADDERIGLLSDELWATLPIDRQEPADLQLEVHDAVDADLSVIVQVNSIISMEGILQALTKQWGSGDTKAARGVRLARKTDMGHLAGYNLTEWLGRQRVMFAPGLARLLGVQAHER